MEILTGIDIVDLERFRQVIEKYKHRFINRVFTDRELSSVPAGDESFRYLCISFSFKESIWKALPEGLQKDFYFRDIEILWHRRKPSAALKGKTNPPGLTVHFYTTERHAVTTAVLISPVFSIPA